MCVNFATMNVNKKYKSDDYSVHGGFLNLLQYSVNVPAVYSIIETQSISVS